MSELRLYLFPPNPVVISFDQPFMSLEILRPIHHLQKDFSIFIRSSKSPALT